MLRMCRFFIWDPGGSTFGSLDTLVYGWGTSRVGFVGSVTLSENLDFLPNFVSGPFWTTWMLRTCFRCCAEPDSVVYGTWNGSRADFGKCVERVTLQSAQEKWTFGGFVFDFVLLDLFRTVLGIAWQWPWMTTRRGSSWTRTWTLALLGQVLRTLASDFAQWSRTCHASGCAP
jgi:hypothetical protein